jgi:hypothetical protein
VSTAVPHCRYLRSKTQVLRRRVRFRVIVHDLDDGPAFAYSSGAFGVHDLPDVYSSFARETVPHLDV